MIRAARIFAPTSSFRLAILDAVVIIGVFYLIAHWIVLDDTLVYFLDDGGAARLAPLLAIFILTMYFSGLYERKHLQGRIFLLQQLGFCAGVGLISQALVSYINAAWTLPRSLALYGLVASIIVLFVTRVLRDAMLSQLEGNGAVLILGTDLTAQRLVRHIARNPGLNLTVAGCLTNTPESAMAPVLGGISDIREVTRSVQPDLIVSGLADARDRMPVAEMVELRYSGCRIEEAGMACELICRHVSARDLRPSRVLFMRDFDAKDVSLAVFITDIAVSSLLLVMGAPFALIYAALLRLSGLSDGKPVFTKEICTGYQGRPFVSRQLRVESSGALAAFARALHLDDWPQLWNVLSRRMSMVGPRPRRLGLARELSRILPVDEYRQNARPGITGWARINLEPGQLTDAIAEVEYDLYYVRNQSVSLYIYILLHGWRAAI
jgi:lipopolysaccharide/colanic/teichoic acid biosynthesis glycosyltransferase